MKNGLNARLGAGPSRGIWAITAGEVAVSAGLLLAVVRREPAPGHHLPFLLMVALFMLAVLAVGRFSTGGGVRSFSLIEAPLVLGLLAIRPLLFVGAWLAGGALALLTVRRQSLVRLCYNLAAFLVEGVAAVIVFHAVSSGSDLVARSTLAGALAAALSASVISVASVGMAIALTEPSKGRGDLVASAVFGLTGSAVTATLTLVGVVIEHTDPASLWLLALPVAAVYLVQRQAGRRSQARVAALSRDPLSGLADRQGVTEHLSELLASGGGSGVACLFIGIEGRAAVSAEYGGETGDQLLVVAAQRLVNCLRGGDLAGRLDGDGLVVVAHVMEEAAAFEAAALGGRIASSLGRPASLGPHLVTSPPAIGVVLVRPEDTAERLLDAAGPAIEAARAGAGAVEILDRGRAADRAAL
jgi:diguanylate cyclase (GGDEF)-like protein